MKNILFSLTPILAVLVVTTTSQNALASEPDTNCKTYNGCTDDVERRFTGCTITYSAVKETLVWKCMECDGDAIPHDVRVREVSKKWTLSNCGKQNGLSATCFVRQLFPRDTSYHCEEGIRTSTVVNQSDDRVVLVAKAPKPASATQDGEGV